MSELGKCLNQISCKAHSKERVRVFCFDCEQALCVRCQKKKHQSHRCGDVGEIEDVLHGLIRGRIDCSARFDVQHSSADRQLVDRLRNFEEEVGVMRQKIQDQADTMKRGIDQHAMEITQETRLYERTDQFWRSTTVEPRWPSSNFPWTHSSMLCEILRITIARQIWIQPFVTSTKKSRALDDERVKMLCRSRSACSSSVKFTTSRLENTWCKNSRNVSLENLQVKIRRYILFKLDTFQTR